MSDTLLRETQPKPGQLPEIVPGQYWDHDTEQYAAIKGAHGAPRVLLWDTNGGPLLTTEQPGIVDVTDRAARELGKISADNLDISLSDLRDAIAGAGAATKTLADLATLLTSVNAKDFASQTTLAAILGKLISDPSTSAKQDILIAKDFATETTLAAIGLLMTALTGKDFATQTTLAEISAKLLTAPSTEAKQDTLISHVDGVETALTILNAKDFATQTTLAAVLAKIIAAPATEAKQDTLNAKDFATQATLAAVLAKIIAAPATEAKQDILNAKDFATQTTLVAILNKIIEAPATEATLASVQATLAQGGIPATTLETTHQNAATTNGNGTAATVSGYGPIAFQITGTPDGATITWEGSVDGTNYTAFSATKTDTGAAATTATATGIYSANVSGYKSVRAVISTAGASTSLTVKSLAVGVARPLTADVITVGKAADNAAVSGNPILLAGRYSTTPATRDNGDVVTLETDATGSLLTKLTGSKALVRVIMADSTVTLGTSQSEIISITPTAGYKAKVINMFIYSPIPTGGTTGTHEFNCHFGSSVNQRAFNIKTAYNKELLISGNAPSSTVDTKTPNNDAIINSNIQKIEFTVAEPLKIQYKNDTGATQTFSRNIRLVVIEEAIIA